MAESYVFCGLQERGTEMLRLPGEDAIISWPNAKSTVIDQRDAYMARTIWAAATGTFLFQSASGLNPTASPSPSLDVNQSEFEAKPRISSWGQAKQDHDISAVSGLHYKKNDPPPSTRIIWSHCVSLDVALQYVLVI